jgi:uncharacterized DUF497 family protein
MSESLRIQRLDWDEWNRNHIIKHNVTVVEVEEVIAGSWYSRETYKSRTLLIGFTASQRMLAIVVGPVPDDPGAYYVFSARPASRKERRQYEQQR